MVDQVEHDAGRLRQDHDPVGQIDGLVDVMGHKHNLTWLGQPEEWARWIEKAMQHNPYDPERFWNHLGRAHFVAGRYGEAVAAFEHITAPDQFHHAFLAACHAQLGDGAAARTHATEVLKRDPNFTIESHLKTLHYKRAEDRDHHRKALLTAGLPVRSTAPSETAIQSGEVDRSPA